MIEYIRRDTITLTDFEIVMCDGDYKEGLAILLNKVKKAPAADVVEVVRCRECYFRELDGADVPVCTGAMAYSNTPDNWFCAAGKPKDGGHNDER